MPGCVQMFERRNQTKWSMQHVGEFAAWCKKRTLMGKSACNIYATNLLNAGAERLDATLAFLHECAPDFLLPCHCTGAQVVDRLRTEFGDTVMKPGGAGEAVEIGRLSATLEPSFSDRAYLHAVRGRLGPRRLRCAG